MRRRLSSSLFSVLAIGLGFTLALGYYTSLVVAPYRMPVYKPQWQQAAWIAAAADKPIAYYRYAFTLTSTPRQAVIVMAAPDLYTLYVNGEEVAENQFNSAQVTGVYDIAPYLLPGKNVIAVGVTRQTYPGPASLIVEGSWYGPRGGSGVITTSSQWRTVNAAQWQRGGELSWKDRDFDDSSWPHARVTQPASPLVYSPLPIAPALLAGLRIGEWMWLPQLDARSGTFRREWAIHGRTIEAAWFGVATTASYSLSVNGKLVASANPTREYIDVYNIAPFLRRGSNVIEVSVSSIYPGGQLAMAGTVVVDGQTTTLPSGPGWLAHAGDVGKAGTTQWAKPASYASVRTITHTIREADGASAVLAHPAIRFMESGPAMSSTEAWRAPAYWSAVILALNGLGLVVFGWIYRKFHSASVNSALSAYAAPQLVGLLVLTGLLLARFDVRLDFDALINAKMLILICLAIMLWLVAILSEVAAQHSLTEEAT